MGMRWIASVIGLGCTVCMIVPPVHAADENIAEAAPAELNDASRQHILQTIEATRQTDPELAQVMEEQLQQMEAGELPLRELMTPSSAEQGLALGAPTLEGAGGVSPGLVGPPIDVGTGGSPRGEVLPPEVRTQLEKLFQEQGTGDPGRDAHVREQAEQILREHGIDPREMGSGHEGEWERGEMPSEGFERAWEQMDPAAREQMERTFSSEGGAHETERPEQFREMFEREATGTEAPHEIESPEHMYEAPTHEMEAPEPPPAPEHDYQAFEQDAPEHAYDMSGEPEPQQPPQP